MATSNVISGSVTCGAVTATSAAITGLLPRAA